MSTRTIDYVIGAGGTAIAPGGRFLLVKAATSAVDIAGRGKAGQDMTFSGVTAGFKVPQLPQELRPDYWFLTSAAAQTVTIVVGDENVDQVFTGTLSTTPASGMTGAAATVGVAEATIAATNAARKTITLRAMNTNTDICYIGPTGVTAVNGMPLYPGDVLSFDNSALIRGISPTAGQSVRYIEET